MVPKRRSSLIPVYPFRLPVSFIKGKGIWLWEKDKEAPYLDALSGRGVCNLGHSHPEVIHALTSQAHQLIHTSNLYHIPKQEELAQRLCEQFQMQAAFFSNSGAEGMEVAMKMAYRYSYLHSIAEPVFITVQGSYHGRTIGALTLSGTTNLIEEKKQLGLNQGNDKTIAIPINDIQMLHHTVAVYQARIVAIVIEPVLGDGGIHPCTKEFLKAIRAVCDTQGYLMIADEIQTGLCRTGFWSTTQAHQVQPDILVLAKALGNGFPIGAYLVNTKAKGLLDGYHGSTFAGNPLGCTVALSVLTILKRDNFESQVQHKGDYLKQALQKKLGNHPLIQEIRGVGLMMGIELKSSAQLFVQAAIQHKLLCDAVSQNTIRLLAPLVISLEEIDELVKRLEKSFMAYMALHTKKRKILS